MLGHIGLNVPDLVAAEIYYNRLMPLVGYEPFLSAADESAFMPAAGKRGTYIFLYPSAESSIYSHDRTGLQHLAFMVPSRSQVHVVHEFATAAGNEVLHPPREFPQYPPPYFATFWLDPFGFMLEAVCHKDLD